jgi:hypothetical protein
MPYPFPSTNADLWSAFTSPTTEVPVLDTDSAQLELVAEALDLVNELWPVDGDYKTLTPDTWRRLRRVLLSVPNLVDA